VGHNHGHGVFVPGAQVNKLDIQAVDFGDELGQAVELVVRSGAQSYSVRQYSHNSFVYASGGP
jgi:hypothetical protein